jgi:ParB family chromosome partitioning protein
MAKIEMIPREKLRVGPHETRLAFDEDAIDDLAVSIRRIGVIVPLLVHPAGDVFTIIAGHRRFAAAKKVGLLELPCCVREDDGPAQTEISLAENLFRADLTPIEQAAAIRDIIDQKIMDVPTLAASMHRSPHWVLAQLDILNWPADVLEVIHHGQLSVSAASNIALVNDDSYRGFLLRNAVEQGATARTTAAWLQAWRAAMPPAEAVTQPSVDGRQPATPALPQAPCIVCNQMFRTDSLAMVMVCMSCINSIRGAIR